MHSSARHERGEKSGILRREPLERLTPAEPDDEPIELELDAILEPGKPEGAETGAFELDHVVLRTPHLDDTSAAVEAVLGLACRRVRETSTVRQAFHRFPDQGGVRGCIVEVVEDERATVTTLWSFRSDRAPIG